MTRWPDVFRPTHAGGEDPARLERPKVHLFPPANPWSGLFAFLKQAAERRSVLFGPRSAFSIRSYLTRRHGADAFAREGLDGGDRAKRLLLLFFTGGHLLKV